MLASRFTYVIFRVLQKPFFFLTNENGEPRSETLDRIKTLSNRSFNCSLNSFNSSSVIFYGRIEIGRESEIMSVTKSISFSRGTPGRSSGYTSGTLLL